MLPFVGEYNHSVDNKGRLIIPSKFRNNFSGSVYLCKGFENCLLILSEEEITKIENKIKESSLTNKDIRKFMRVFFSGMVEGNFDSQGRVLIPSKLLEFASLKKETTVVGTGFYVEIWNKDTWESTLSDLDEDRGELTSILEGIL